ncbi:hypothetical protein V8C26DRAFT_226191 [Trichoderma gracile]
MHVWLACFDLSPSLFRLLACFCFVDRLSSLSGPLVRSPGLRRQRAAGSEAVLQESESSTACTAHTGRRRRGTYTAGARRES